MLKFVTFNIRYDNGNDGLNDFVNRKAFILEKIEKEKPDVICFQEVLVHVAAWLKEALKDYYVAGCGRSEQLEDEQVAVAWRKDRLNLISMETFWLSDTPYVPASRYEEQSICPRVCTEVVLEDMQEKKAFRLFDIHLDHMGVAARRKGLTQILKKAENEVLFPQLPVILAGDFNAPPHAEEFDIFKEYNGYVNAADGIGVTYHGFLEMDTPVCIDHIYICNANGYPFALECKHVEKWQDQRDGMWLSDHYPVCAELEWVRLEK